MHISENILRRTKIRRWYGTTPICFRDITRSPYTVLRVNANATKKEIKSSFRKLAKMHHPDLNPTVDKVIAQDKMSELYSAYDLLMDDDFSARVGDNRVALAVEMYTMNELKMDNLHDVHILKIMYDEIVVDNNNFSDNAQVREQEITATQLTRTPVLQVKAHPDDSVSDLKRQLQNSYGREWGLGDRRLDRDGIAKGWELVAGADGSVLSYHLFLHSYRVHHHDIIYAVVRRHVSKN